MRQGPFDCIIVQVFKELVAMLAFTWKLKIFRPRRIGVVKAQRYWHEIN
jgi:hypothetical protein